ncbi:hypothetical protein [Cognataquiflexum rubidum]|uniref:hypothetical protein n=1 Tax=Cognataquiflexum rubidum TaxID=2922273 RepID=UPI001F12B08E|nr:hypothetical protein [Cognataquiflexum rubidum]MCH6236028.1 hypothetical protein [Cognataquiflexum rubidum]
MNFLAALTLSIFHLLMQQLFTQQTAKARATTPAGNNRNYRDHHLPNLPSFSSWAFISCAGVIF